MFNLAIQLEETNRGKVAFSGLAQSIIVGAISGAVTSGIGSIAKDMMLTATNLVEKAGVALFQASMHGIAQGAIQGITGGSFEQSFLTAAVSSLAGSAYGAALKGFANSGVGQVLFSTVAGGTTSALQGGNFWQGAGMGFTIGLLNHLAHEMAQRADITGRLKAAGYNDPQAAADYEGLSLKEFAVKVFPDMYAQANKPQFEKKESIIYKGESANGLTNGEWNPATNKGNLTSPIQIAKSAFSSYLQLASTMGHELNHAIDYISGNMSLWYKKGGESYRKNMTESKAYNWVFNNGGIDNPKMRTFYSNQLKN
jgi:hypothetical protein